MADVTELVVHASRPLAEELIRYMHRAGQTSVRCEIQPEGTSSVRHVILGPEEARQVVEAFLAGFSRGIERKGG